MLDWKTAEGRRRLAWAVPALLSLVLFANSLPNGFVYDDKFIIEGNDLVQEKRVAEILTSTYWAGEDRNLGLYRPLTLLSYVGNLLVGGESPFGYHLVNVLLHAAVATLAFAAFLRLSGSLGIALLGGALFAAHPVHVEAVANVVGRAEILAAGGVLAALLLHVRSCEAEGDERWRMLGFACAAFAFALLCKENAITFALVPALHDACFLRPARGLTRAWFRTRLPWHGAYLGVAVGYLALRAFVTGGLSVPVIGAYDNPLAPVSLGVRLPSAVGIVGRYTWLFLFPQHLSYDYGANLVVPYSTPFEPWFLFGLVVLAGLGWLFVRSWERAPFVAFAIGLTVMTYSVVANVITPIGVSMAERLFYLPSVGPCGAAAVGVAALARRFAGVGARGRLALVAASLVIVAALSVRTVVRNPVWRSNESLFLDSLDLDRASAKMRCNAGVTLVKQGRIREAVPHLEASVQVNPQPIALFMLGKVHGTIDDQEGKRDYYAKAMRVGPDSFWGLMARGWLAMMDDGFAAALEAFERAVARKPNGEGGRYSIGLASYRLGDHERAVRELEASGELAVETDIKRRLFLGLAHEGLGQHAQAAAVYAAAAELHPDAPEAFQARRQVARGRALMKDRDYAGGRREFQAALEQSPEDAAARYYLGIAHYNLRDYGSAVAALEGVAGLTGSLEEERFRVLGMAHEHLDQPDAAATSFAEGLEQFPEAPELLERLAVLEYSKLKRYPDALAHFRRLLEIEPDHPRRGEYERAVAWLSRRVPRPGGDPH